MALWFVVPLAVGLAFLCEHYRQQRNDLAAWIQHKHPEDLE